MRWPLESFEVTQGFKPADNPAHEGNDLAAPSGTPIKAPESGTVIAVNSGWKPGGYFGGNFVKMTGNTGYTYYMGHMSKVSATVGQRVKEGQVIGNVGMTGQATGPHIHFEMSKFGQGMLDPSKVIKKGDEMVTELGLDAAYRLLLGKNMTAYGKKAYLGKVTFDQAYKKIAATPEAKAHAKELKAAINLINNNLPKAAR